MAKLASVDDLGNYCKRKLGAPVVNIEIDDTQLVDRIEDALQMFTQRHYDGYDEVYISHTVSEDDVLNGYIIIPDDIEAILDIYAVGGSSDTSVEAFDRLSFRLANSDIFDFLHTGGGGLVDYYMTQAHISLIQEIFVPKTTFHFNSLTHRLAILDPIRVGGQFAYRAYRLVDAEDFEDVYNNEWVKKYTTALIKRQWGTNLKKFDGVQMPGGITLNGQVIFDEANTEVDALEQEFSLTYELPLDMVWA